MRFQGAGGRLRGPAGGNGGGVTSWLFPHGEPALVPWAENPVGRALPGSTAIRQEEEDRTGGRSGRRRVPCVWSRGGKGGKGTATWRPWRPRVAGARPPSLFVNRVQGRAVVSGGQGKEEARGRGRETARPRRDRVRGSLGRGRGPEFFRGSSGAWNGRSKALARSNGRGNAEARYDETALCPLKSSRERRGGREKSPPAPDKIGGHDAAIFGPPATPECSKQRPVRSPVPPINLLPPDGTILSRSTSGCPSRPIQRRPDGPAGKEHNAQARSTLAAPCQQQFTDTPPHRQCIRFITPCPAASYPPGS